jgi:hypothetical protein
MSDLFNDLRNNTNVITHAETAARSLVSLYESGYLLHFDTQETTFLGWFYGNPTGGLISHNSQWVVMGGEHLVVWARGVLTEIPLKWIFALRQTDTDKVHILTDPWDSSSAIWELNITSFELKKIRSFSDYQEQPFSTEVIW